MLNAQKADEVRMLTGRLFEAINDIGADQLGDVKAIIEEHLKKLRDKSAISTRGKLNLSI